VKKGASVKQVKRINEEKAYKKAAELKNLGTFYTYDIKYKWKNQLRKIEL
jgi:hypothetical protein